MKTKILTFALSLIQLFAIAQISTREIVDEKEYERPLIYDSTYFFYKSDIDFKVYLNQRIYILPKSANNELDGYTDFYTEKVSVGYGPIDSYTYKPNQNSLTEYNILENKYLKILDVGVKGDWNGYNEFWFKLFHEENHDTIFYCPPSALCEYRALSEMPFILEGFFEYNKNKFVGKYFIAKDSISEHTAFNGLYSRDPLIDITSGEKIKCEKGSKWLCSDITLVDLKSTYSYYVPVLIFKDDLNREIMVSFAKYIHNEADDGTYIFNTKAKIDNFYSMEEYQFLNLQKQEQEKLRIQLEKELEAKRKAKNEKLINKYGNKYANLIINKKVVVGMTKEMCSESWGKPYETDRVTMEDKLYEVWTYDFKTFLYFENDVLKLIKE